MFLNEKQIKMAEEVISKKSQDPELLTSLRNVNNKHLSDGNKELLQNILLNEMLEKGINNAEEPTEYGKELDEIIGQLEQIDE